VNEEKEGHLFNAKEITFFDFGKDVSIEDEDFVDVPLNYFEIINDAREERER
jgi:hypothetical protein